MVEEITTNEEEEEEIVYFPKVDRGRLYSVLLIIVIMVSIYVSIVINMFWISVFVVIPILTISKREEVSQEKFDLKQKAIDGFSKLMKIILISTVVGASLFILIQWGILFTTIVISAIITKRNFEKNNWVKSEVS